MKKTFKTLAITGLAVLAMSAVAAGSAFGALPEFRQGGEPLAKVVTASGGGGASKLETVKGREVKCEANAASGELTGPTSVAKIVATFTGCKGPSGTTCTSSGAASGEIVTATLSGELGYVEGTAEEAKKVGLDLKPTSGSYFAEFKCLTLGQGALLKVKAGSVIGQITPVNKEQATATLTFEQSGGVQQFTHFEGGTEDVLMTEGIKEGFLGEGFALEQSAQESTGTLTLSQAVELKA